MTSLGAVGSYQNVLWRSIGSLGYLGHSTHGGRVVVRGGWTSGGCGVVTLEPWVSLAWKSLLIMVEHLLVITKVGRAGVVAWPGAGVSRARLLAVVPHAMTSCAGLVPHATQTLPLP